MPVMKAYNVKIVLLVFLATILTFAVPYLNRVIGKDSLDYLTAVYSLLGGSILLIGAYKRAAWTGSGEKRIGFFYIGGCIMMICGIIIFALKSFGK
jgi:membrane protease YdiL (CAAX protease family)